MSDDCYQRCIRQCNSEPEHENGLEEVKEQGQDCKEASIMPPSMLSINTRKEWLQLANIIL